MNYAQELKLDTCGKEIESAKMFCVSAKAETEITPDCQDCFPTVESVIEGNVVTLPPAGVAAIEITLK
jgi:hypothetical protein